MFIINTFIHVLCPLFWNQCLRLQLFFTRVFSKPGKEVRADTAGSCFLLLAVTLVSHFYTLDVILGCS